MFSFHSYYTTTPKFPEKKFGRNLSPRTNENRPKLGFTGLVSPKKLFKKSKNKLEFVLPNFVRYFQHYNKNIPELEITENIQSKVFYDNEMTKLFNVKIQSSLLTFHGC